MDLSDLGFAQINPELEKSKYQKYRDEYYILANMKQSGMICREEWLDLWMSLCEKYDISINPRLLTQNWVRRHLNNKPFLDKPSNINFNET